MKVAGDRDYFMQFVPADWRNDEQLGLCSLAARGLWVELMCLAHKADGYVRVGDAVPTTAELARLVRSTPQEVRKLLDELTRNRVCSIEEADHAIYSRRMVRDAKRRAINRQNGARGGSPKLLPVSVDDSVNQITNRNEHNYNKNLESEVDPLTPLPPFEQFWRTWPPEKRRRRGQAEAAFGIINPDEGVLALMLAALRRDRQSSDWRNKNGRYIPNPDTWLANRPWDDHGSERAASVAADVAQFASRAGIRKYDIQHFFAGATLIRDRSGIVTLAIEDPELRAFVDRNFSEGLNAVVVADGGDRLVIGSAS